jgi:LysM repeat protein
LRRKYWSIIILVAFATCFVVLQMGVSAAAQPQTHTVQEGDTLWDICKYYYGNEELWPKLWQMNPFVTNPHLLKPGDTITLLEEFPVKKKAIVQDKSASPKEVPREFVYGETGIDVSGFTEEKSIGFLSTQKVEPLGQILSGEAERVVLAEGDMLYMSIKKELDIKPGNQFTIYKESRLLTHPLTKKSAGYVISFLGRVSIIERAGEVNAGGDKKIEVEPGTILYKGEIIESYKAARVGDSILSYEPVSACIEPMPMERELITNVVAAKYLREIGGQFTVVYLPYGYNDGVRRGNLFEIFERKEVLAPKKTTLPDVTFGHLVVLEARPATSTGVVIETLEEFPIGAYVRGVDWRNAHHVLSLLKRCSLK